ncbi:16S rRNA (adenine(1518)-N(6)/adenine(1519)-N(6))-dimethyltransferase RsmA [Lentilactobacillus sp. SPB1-3]|uniref:16S rRNA (Adenine(1518)-N(6)/adenine(1519)-N(6))-dimethyltransferase RsmA n=1 Tax=Lentilactobacillus terminaliae TaxID=3003483 RepID=A0ACD5DGR5_9LACO|nr:16S rRNA (adenine(1518)-N(6)/adenine(1519)-N(6))-dimethyltransferase RsmA [Lentilactobacillus sp. SPB1-3]MCZ0977942.1 16S rRNA (adenine(1518)-N(6)/adenine(1519)-N(6))-dimethyltransferase RsmA [Lentilactobacillus sp. SPB1-3]
MNDFLEIGTETRTMAILNQYRLFAKKGLGQNFLVDIDVLRRIVTTAEITEDDSVVEIGPGIGALTEQLAKNASKVVAFEIDDNLLPVLYDTLHDYSNIKIINQDVLKANLPQVIDEEFGTNKSVKVVANLPYYITTPIIMDLLHNDDRIESIVVMMQKEVAERLTAKPSTKAYGSLSVIMQQQKNVDIAFLVSKDSFIPSPKVDSAIIKITTKEQTGSQPFDLKKFQGFVRGCFMHRRKSLYNNLQGIFGKTAEIKENIKEVTTEMGLSDNARPEELTVEEFVELCNRCNTKGLIA